MNTDGSLEEIIQGVFVCEQVVRIFHASGALQVCFQSEG
jgi:hypothetical protein